MTTTRSKATALLDHLIENLLGQNASSELALALKHDYRTELPDIMDLHPDEIDALVCPIKDKDGNMKERDVHRRYKLLLRILQSYIHFVTSQGNTDYLALTKDDFDNYRIRFYNASHPHTAPTTTPTYSSGPTKNTQPFTQPPTEDIKKSIKRDALLNQIIENVLGKDASSTLALGLKYENVATLPDVMGLHENDIEMLVYLGKDKDGDEEKEMNVPHWDKQLLHILQSFIHYKTSKGVTDYFALTKDDFDIYRDRFYNPCHPHTAPITPSTYSNAPKANNHLFSILPAEIFKKSIKRIKTHYRDLILRLFLTNLL